MTLLPTNGVRPRSGTAVSGGKRTGGPVKNVMEEPIEPPLPYCLESKTNKSPRHHRRHRRNKKPHCAESRIF